MTLKNKKPKSLIYISKNLSDLEKGGYNYYKMLRFSANFLKCYRVVKFFNAAKNLMETAKALITLIPKWPELRCNINNKCVTMCDYVRYEC